MLLFKTLALAAVMAFTAGEALAKKNCWCDWKAGSKNGTEVHGYGSLKEWSDITIKEGGMLVEKWCANECSKKASPDIGKQFLADSACSKGVPNGTIVAAFSKVGAYGNNDMDAANKPLINTGAVYNCPQGGNLSGTNCIVTVAAKATCPKDYWLENQKQPFQCVKQACAQGSMPGVPAWLAIGGAVNGGKYLTDDKGGSRFFINASYSCESGFNLSGQNCVKTYSANLVSPKVCKFQP